MEDMQSKKVWRVIKKDQIPNNYRLIGNKWVFKKKCNGINHARLVVLGYNQISGIDYSKSFAPVMNDMTLRIILVLGLLKKLKEPCD